QGKWEEAALEFNKAIGIEKEPALLALLYRNRARLHLERQDLNAALQDYNRAIKQEPPASKSAELGRTHNQRGHLLYRLERYDEAVAAYDQALAILPEYASAHLGRAEALL